MIVDYDTNVLQGHREEIGVRGITELILTLKRPEMPQS